MSMNNLDRLRKNPLYFSNIDVRRDCSLIIRKTKDGNKQYTQVLYKKNGQEARILPPPGGFLGTKITYEGNAGEHDRFINGPVTHTRAVHKFSWLFGGTGSGSTYTDKDKSVFPALEAEHTAFAKWLVKTKVDLISLFFEQAHLHSQAADWKESLLQDAYKTMIMDRIVPENVTKTFGVADLVASDTKYANALNKVLEDRFQEEAKHGKDIPLDLTESLSFFHTNKNQVLRKGLWLEKPVFEKDMSQPYDKSWQEPHVPYGVSTPDEFDKLVAGMAPMYKYVPVKFMTPPQGPEKKSVSIEPMKRRCISKDMIRNAKNDVWIQHPGNDPGKGFRMLVQAPMTLTVKYKERKVNPSVKPYGNQIKVWTRDSYSGSEDVTFEDDIEVPTMDTGASPETPANAESGSDRPGLKRSRDDNDGQAQTTKENVGEPPDAKRVKTEDGSQAHTTATSNSDGDMWNDAASWDDDGSGLMPTVGTDPQPCL